MSVKLVVFDFDGTLFDTKPLLRSLIKKHADLFTLPKVTQKKGESFDDFLVRLGVQQKVFLHIAQRREIALTPQLIARITPVSGLTSLRRIQTRSIIVSNADTQLMKTVVRNNRLDFFLDIIGADQFRTKEDVFRNLLKKYRVKKNEVLYVGDRPLDVRLARRFGCRVVLIYSTASWSNQKSILAAGADGYITTLDDLFPFLV